MREGEKEVWRNSIGDIYRRAVCVTREGGMEGGKDVRREGGI